MRAVIYREGGLAIGETPDPVPDRGQVLVRTLACGICGSDLHFVHHADQFVAAAEHAGAPTGIDLRRDMVLGHEFCAEVVDYGMGAARRFKPGTRVCSMPTARVGGHWRTVGQSNDLPGGFGELMSLTEELLIEAPNGLPAAHAALTEPMAVGWHAVRLARLSFSDRVLVLGCGPIGLAVIAGLKIAGIHPIRAADFSPGRRKLAEAMGADEVIDPAERSAYDALAAAGDPCTVFECVGAPGMIRAAMAGAPRGAQIIVVGACMEADAIEPMVGIFKALSLRFALAYTGEEFAQALGFLAEGLIDARLLVTGQVGLEQTQAAFEALATPGAHAKIVVEPWR